MSIRVLIKEYPHRAIALTTSTHALVLRHSSTSSSDPYSSSNPNSNSQTSLSQSSSNGAARCMVEFSSLGEVDLDGYRSLNLGNAHGTLGLITVNGDVFLCVVSAASRVATVRPGENVLRIAGVAFYCLNSSNYDHMLNDEVNPYPTDTIDDEGFEMGFGRGKGESPLEHPCMALKKLLSSGTFYYSSDFDLTRRLQERSSDAATVSIDSLDAGFLWNSYMIQPLVDFRSRLSQHEKEALDTSGILTSAIRGFASTITVPSASSPVKVPGSGLPSTMTLISRLSCRRAGTRFNARGMDDDGNVANFVETETIFWAPSGVCFSYVQIRGSVPVFWEQSTGLLPGQQKITITRSPEATQPAFNKHMENLELSYGSIHVVNLLSNEKSGEVELSNRYRYHVQHCPLNAVHEKDSSEHELLQLTEYDFHAETRGPGGYEAASMITQWIQSAADGFAYYLSEEDDAQDGPHHNGHQEHNRRSSTILQQEGVFRTNCLDCLDRTNLVQTIISRLAMETFLRHKRLNATPDFWVRHGSMWADNGDALSRIYAGTGALKSSFTRHGKMSLAGALADARKSATRMYINNFADKGRQNTIDLLLGRLMGQMPVHLYDPINDYVQNELNKRSAEFTEQDLIHIFVGTFNLNGRPNGLNEDLSPWLCPNVDQSQQCPEIVAVGFQEIVELSPQQIMSTDPAPRQAWEAAVRHTLNVNAKRHGKEEYVLLRGGQLVGASLSVFVRASILKSIKNVEGAEKKTGLSGMAGNKGAVAIRMELANTSFCFVTAHLAAGFTNYEERNRDYKTISRGLRFQRNRSIDDHDNVIWLGDFNYRIGLNNDNVRRLVRVNDLGTLYENDQLNIQMVAGLAFPFYSEARIAFLPTYRFDVGTENYDTSEKQRIPAWCDRVLRKGDSLRQIHYNSAPLKFSDHRPVYATFECIINMVDEKRREKLSNEIYKQRRAVVGDTRATGQAEDTDDEDLLGYDSIEPGLPPASSDKRKWWLDNGLPARSRVQPPGPDFLPNSNRPSNPFKPSPESDWVEVKRESPAPPPPRGSSRAMTVDFNGPAARPSVNQNLNPRVRKLIAPPFNSNQTTSAPNSPTSHANSSNNTAIPNLDGTTPASRPSYTPHQQPTFAKSNLTRSLTSASTSSSQSFPSLPIRSSTPGASSSHSGMNIPRKPAPPPVPGKKPSLRALEASGSGGRRSQTSDRDAGFERYRDEPEEKGRKESIPLPPAPRRSMAAAASAASQVERKPVSIASASGGGNDARGSDVGATPPLPPRRTETGLSMQSGSGSASMRSGAGAGAGRNKSLLDDDTSIEEQEVLRGWEVLRPVS